MVNFTAAKRLETDNVLPKSWISDEYRSQMLKLLRTENGYDYGEFTSWNFIHKNFTLNKAVDTKVLKGVPIRQKRLICSQSLQIM